ncbi:glycosyltransferase family 4 protein [Stakelama tenebrarum]|uniref:Glycosyltransferase family 4 protein n=1 Tax=Stakelama tenebrarum TaxID=2711215 RepID=A0A6G6Y4M9_9SPHN|nr:glycosyltransferase family 4 protein [Sphingosinithalassobacter tenebrarum]QIG79526.1 glycosyltransferase family 4 protein [Sphingosinithalassobacter tenebrarum]
MGARRRLVCLLGGTMQHRGGVESFCERACTAFEQHSRSWDVEWIAADTAFARPATLGRIAAGMRRLRQAKRKGAAAVWIQVTNLPDLLYIGWARLIGLPVIVTPHYGRNFTIERWARRTPFVRFALARADRLALLFDRQPSDITLPERTKRASIGTFLPRSIFELSSPPSEGPATLTLLHAARFSEQKGSFRFVEICAALHAKGLPFRATMIGRGDASTMARIESEIDAAGLAGHVTICSWADESEMAALLNDTDVLVHLSTLDCFPLIVLEALAVGVVPVVHELPGPCEMVERYAGLAVAGNAVADVVDWIAARDVQVLRTERSALRTQVRGDYQWEQPIRKIEALLDSVAPPIAHPTQ